MAGEYGDLNGRPHYHACIFGHDFEDKLFFKKSPSGEDIYTSAVLQKLWPYGYSSTAAVTFESAAYVARYCLKKITGDLAEEHYKRYDYLGEYQLTPEYNQMSRGQGIGKSWLIKYERDVYAYDYIITREGNKTRVPPYYDKIYKELHKEDDTFEEIKLKRVQDARRWLDDNTPLRLAIKEQVAIKRTEQLKRGKI